MEPAATFDVAARTPQTSRPRRADKEPRPDRWYILGRAYDLGSFAHPGGNDALRIGLGRDATYLVMGHHLAEPRALLRMLAPFARPTDSDWDPHGTYATAASRDAVLDDAVLRSSKEVLRSYKAEVGRLDAPRSSSRSRPCSPSPSSRESRSGGAGLSGGAAGQPWPPGFAR